ncbi:MAG: hypothetical protein M3Y27_24805, partial [Acidobacteriota bacterium]|nr:hypothetical protein [Acidobacteriota bacterium]
LGYLVDFDFRLFFSEVFRNSGGFDVVIGNPPYGIVFDIRMKGILTGAYQSFRQNSDTYTAGLRAENETVRIGDTFSEWSRRCETKLGESGGSTARSLSGKQWKG